MFYRNGVRKYYPHACAVQETPRWWMVWDITHDEQERLKRECWPQDWHIRAMLGIGGPNEFVPRSMLGMGLTEEEAWYDAARNVWRQMGRVLR